MATLSSRIDSVTSSINSNKQSIKSAIANKGVSISSSNPTFNELISGINNITLESGKSSISSSKSFFPVNTPSYTASDKNTVPNGVAVTCSSDLIISDYLYRCYFSSYRVNDVNVNEHFEFDWGIIKIPILGNTITTLKSYSIGNEDTNYSTFLLGASLSLQAFIITTRLTTSSFMGGQGLWAYKVVTNTKTKLTSTYIGKSGYYAYWHTTLSYNGSIYNMSTSNYIYANFSQSYAGDPFLYKFDLSNLTSTAVFNLKTVGSSSYSSCFGVKDDRYAYIGYSTTSRNSSTNIPRTSFFYYRGDISLGTGTSICSTSLSDFSGNSTNLAFWLSNGAIFTFSNGYLFIGQENILSSKYPLENLSNEIIYDTYDYSVPKAFYYSSGKIYFVCNKNSQWWWGSVNIPPYLYKLSFTETDKASFDGKVSFNSNMSSSGKSISKKVVRTYYTNDSRVSLSLKLTK